VLSPATDTLPIWKHEMTLHPDNPVLTTAVTGTGGVVCADPRLWVINDRLYCFFESSDASELGQDWLAVSDDGETWGEFSRISTAATHYAHPVVYEENGVIHCYMQRGSGLIGYRSSPVAGFPNWSAETVVFDSEAFGWHHMREFEIFKHTDGNYYLLGLTGDGASQDQQVRGMWCATLTSDWNTDGTLISASPLFDCDDVPWVEYIVEISRLFAGGRMLLYFGATRRYDNKQAIGVYEIESLTTTGMTGAWVANNHTFGLATSGWDSQWIHCMSAAYFGGRWVVAYDANEDGAWRTGFAYRA
jgi:hypothetical protein